MPAQRSALVMNSVGRRMVRPPGNQHPNRFAGGGEQADRLPPDVPGGSRGSAPILAAVRTLALLPQAVHVRPRGETVITRLARIPVIQAIRSWLDQYQSDAALSRAFKRCTGMPPGRARNAPASS